MAAHTQTWVKVNVPVDEGVAEIVAVLNSLPGLETLQSCQGDPGGREGYVYFSYGDWQKMGRLIFEKIAPRLKERLDEDADVLIKATDNEEPMAKLSFRAEAAGVVASALKEALL